MSGRRLRYQCTDGHLSGCCGGECSTIKIQRCCRVKNYNGAAWMQGEASSVCTCPKGSSGTFPGAQWRRALRRPSAKRIEASQFTVHASVGTVHRGALLLEALSEFLTVVDIADPDSRRTRQRPACVASARYRNLHLSYNSRRSRHPLFHSSGSVCVLYVKP